MISTRTVQHCSALYKRHRTIDARIGKRSRESIKLSEHRSSHNSYVQDEKIYHTAPQWQVCGLFSTMALAACLTNGLLASKSYDILPLSLFVTL